MNPPNLAKYLIFVTFALSAFQFNTVLTEKNAEIDIPVQVIYSNGSAPVIPTSVKHKSRKYFEILSSELKTGENVDLTSHPNLYLLPNTSECGFSATYLNSDNSSVVLKPDNKRTARSLALPLLSRKKRIVGGNFPVLGQFPWAVRIDAIHGDSGNASLRCGGTLISSRYVLTLARCIRGLPARYTLQYVTLSNTDRRLKSQCALGSETNCANATLMEIEDVIIHEEFVKTSAWNDIALLRLTEPVEFSEFLRPICLPSTESVLDDWKNNKLTVYGWGREVADDESGEEDAAGGSVFSPNLKSLNISIVRREDCNRLYRRKTGKLAANRFCAGQEYETGVCSGDNGGPAMKKIKILQGSNSTVIEERYYQFGMIHFGHCALDGIPNIYVNVWYYMSWILDNIKP